MEKKPKREGRKPYQKPAFSSEELFESNVLACDKLPGPPGSPCTAGHANPHST